jgi:hypothetical protein
MGDRQANHSALNWSAIGAADVAVIGTTQRLRTALKWSAGAVGFATAAYATYVGVEWVRYGRPDSPKPCDADDLLDRFMPTFEVAERRHIFVAAPAETTFTAACEGDLLQTPIIRAIFRSRELILGSQRDSAEHPRGVVAFTKSIGWSVLAEVPGREIVMGTVTQPWNPNVVFRRLTPEEFVMFNEPDYVKIAWTLRAHPVGNHDSIFRHETRVMTTDPAARAKFRRYWAFFSPGIKLIRWLMLKPLRRDAERRATAARLTSRLCLRSDSRLEQRASGWSLLALPETGVRSAAKTKKAR